MCGSGWPLRAPRGMAPARRTEAAESGPPRKMAEGPPPMQEGAALPLMAVLEIQRTLGGLTKSVESLTQTQERMNTELSVVAGKVNQAQTVLKVVGAILTAAILGLGWLIATIIGPVLDRVLPAKP